MGLIKTLRRKRLQGQPLSSAREEILACIPLYRRLPEQDRRELKGLIQVFLAEKSFEGCGGFAMTEEARVTVAVQACVLLLHRDTGFFP